MACKLWKNKQNHKKNCLKQLWHYVCVVHVHVCVCVCCVPHNDMFFGATPQGGQLVVAKKAGVHEKGTVYLCHKDK